MELNLKTIVLNKSTDPVRIYFISDPHIGHKNHDEDKFNKHILQCKNDEFGYCFFMGDEVDGRNPDHKFFDFDQTDKRIPMKSYLKNCYDIFEEKISVIGAKKIIGMHEGNHSKEIKFGFPFMQTICEKLKVPFLGYRAFTQLRFRHKTSQKLKKHSITVFSTHGSGGGRGTGAKVNRIEQESLSNVADIYAQGHNHALTFTHGIKNYLSCNNDSDLMLMEKEEYFLNCGSYLKSYQEGNFSYGEKASYKPQQTGCIMLEISPYHGSITPYILK